MKNKLLFLIVQAILLLGSGCKVFDNEVLVPGYVYIPEALLQTNNDGSQGDTTTKFTDVWVYSAGNLEGAFRLGVPIPIQKTGLTEIAVDAGILKTGQDFERIPYLLTSREYFSVNLRPNSVDTIRPRFKYVNTANFKMIEDFDRVGFRFEKYAGRQGDTVIRVNSGDSARTPGKNSGAIILSDSTDEFILTSTELFQLAAFNPVFLEMDYHTDLIFEVGLYASNGSDIVRLNSFYAYPTPADRKWNKAYIDLTQQVSSYRGYSFKIYIRVFKQTGTPAPRIFIDNIKLIEG